MYRFFSKSVRLLAILLVSVPVQAEVYKWVDGQGRTHYGDAPPVKTKAQALDIQSTSPQASGSPGDAQPETAAEDVRVRQERIYKALRDKRIQHEKTVAEAKKKAEDHAQACLRAKNRIEHMKKIGTFYTENPDGTVTYLSDKEGDAHRREALQSYEKNCGQ